MPSKQKFRVKLKVACREETGEEFILYTDRELSERNAVYLADMEQTIASMPKTDDEAEDEKRAAGIRLAITTEIEAKTARQKAERDEALPVAVDYEFVIQKPTMGEHMDALDKANILDENTGEVRFNENAYVRELLPNCIEGMKPKEVLDLTPTVAGELRFRFLRSISPNPNRLPFTSPPPAAS